MSSCFFSSREKIRISPMSVSRKCFKTVWPKEPVPPVISRVLFLNIINLILSNKHLTIYFIKYEFLQYLFSNKRLKIAFPNDPVPPVIISVFPSNNDILLVLRSYI